MCTIRRRTLFPNDHLIAIDLCAHPLATESDRTALSAVISAAASGSMIAQQDYDDYLLIVERLS